MGNKTINKFYGTVIQYFYDNEKLNLIISKLNTMDQVLETLKQQLTEANTKLDETNVSIDGIGVDVAFLKGRIDALAASGTATAAELAELAALGNTLQEKVNGIKGKTADLDSATDSSGL